MLIAYAAERLPVRLTVPVAAALALAAAAGVWPGPAPFVADVSLALLLFVLLRMADDLADRERDCRLHPARTICSAATARQVAAACGSTGVATILVVAHRAGLTAPLAALALLLGALAAWYRLRGPRTLAGDHALLLKYPAVVFIVAGERAAAAPVPAAMSMAAVYLGACLYEAWHDPAAPLARHRALVMSETAALLAALAALAVLATTHLAGGPA